jgi:hypothetical protein
VTLAADEPVEALSGWDTGWVTSETSGLMPVLLLVLWRTTTPDERRPQARAAAAAARWECMFPSHVSPNAESKTSAGISQCILKPQTLGLLSSVALFMQPLGSKLVKGACFAAC